MTLGESPPFFRLLILGGVLQPPSDVAKLLRKREEEEKEIQENNVHRNVKEATRRVGRCCFFFLSGATGRNRKVGLVYNLYLTIYIYI